LTNVDLIGRAARAGVDLVQIREPDLDDRSLTALVSQAVELTERTQTRVVVNDRIDVALSTGAAGVHLRHDSPPAERARSLCPDSWLVGRSVHDVDEAEDVAKSGAIDYLIMGTVFESISKPGCAPAGIDALAQVAGRVPQPVLAIGGVTVGRAEAVAHAGAGGVAAVGEFMAAGSALDTVVSRFREAFDRGRSSSSQVDIDV
jgi:thiamine-phosphate pyrophosphorylase